MKLKRATHMIDRVIRVGENGIIAILLFEMVVLIFLLILARYVLKISLPWTEEIARYSMVTMVYLGAAVGFRERKHIIIEWLSTYIRSEWIRIVPTVLSLACAGAILVLSYQDFVTTIRMGSTFTTLPIPLYWTRIGLVVASILFIYHLSKGLAKSVSALRNKRGSQLI